MKFIGDKEIIFEIAYHPSNMFLCSAVKKRYILESHPSSRGEVGDYHSYQERFRPVTPPYPYQQFQDQPCAHHFYHGFHNRPAGEYQRMS